MRLNHKTLSDFDAERLVMEMLYDCERSVRERRFEEIRGWRKALALGAAGLAGLSPMKAQAQGDWPSFEQTAQQPSGEQATSMSDLSQQIRDAENQLTKAWQVLSPRMKNILRQGQRDWIKEKDAAQPADKLQMIKDQIGFLQNKADADQAYQKAYQIGIQFKKGHPNMRTISRNDIEQIVDRLMDKLDAPGDERGSVEVGFLIGAKLRALDYEQDQAQQPAGDINAQIEDAEQDLNQIWRAFTPKQKAQLLQDQRGWIKQKDATKGKEKSQMIQDRME